MLIFEIRSVNTKYEKGEIVGIHVQYSAREKDGYTSVSGRIEMTSEEYEGNEPIAKLEEAARRHLIELVSADEDDEDEGTDEEEAEEDDVEGE